VELPSKFFVRDMPRLSVDIDLTYVPVTDRNKALSAISTILFDLGKYIKKTFPDAVITKQLQHNSTLLKGLDINSNDAAVKIEPNSILRGTIFPTEKRVLCQNAQKLFELFVETQTLLWKRNSSSPLRVAIPIGNCLVFPILINYRMTSR